MGNSFNDYFHKKGFLYDHGLFYQSHMDTTDFENEYINLRREEGRLYSDEIVMYLPLISKDHPLHHEWKIREKSAKELATYLRKKKIESVLEIGCGNGWMTNYLSRALGVECCGIDVNKTELEQATRLFKNKPNEHTITFAYADVLSSELDRPIADIVVLASVIQYFPDLEKLLSKLRLLIKSNGEIHILDSPIYDSEYDLTEAKRKSNNYFNKLRHNNMSIHYHHHTWHCPKDLKFKLLHNPKSITGKLKRALADQSPFPWIKVYV